MHPNFERNLDPRLQLAYGPPSPNLHPEKIFIDLPTVKSNKTETQRNIYCTYCIRDL